MPMRDSNSQSHSLVLLVPSESGYYGVYDYCTAEYLKQAGCSKTKHLELGKAGIHGRSHMFLMENNSKQIQRSSRSASSRRDTNRTATVEGQDVLN
ncbi:putative secreted lipase [Metarhizium anisopliae]|nr:putative secreted lipase [Metarhizium anisopliae]